MSNEEKTKGSDRKRQPPFYNWRMYATTAGFPVFAVAIMGFALVLLMARWAQVNHQEAEALRQQMQQQQERFAALSQELEFVKHQNVILTMRFEAMAYDGYYITVDLEKHLLSVMRAGDVIESFPCATGKGSCTNSNGEQFEFTTPVGRRVVLEKEEDPVWIRPDWVWLEKGETVPENITRDERMLEGILGKFRLRMGEGYDIHGTRFEDIIPGDRTHGCIRLGRENLEKVYRLVEVGAPVYIF